MERRFIPQHGDSRIELEDREGAPGKALVGYAALYYDTADPAGTQYELDQGLFERIRPGAFDRAVREDDVVCLFNHDRNHVLGRTKNGTMKLTLFSKGLRYTVHPPDTSSGRDVLALAARGDLKGSSFSFGVLKESWERADGFDVRWLEDVRVADVGPVTEPAYTGTSVGVRAEGSVEEALAARDRWQAAEAERLATAAKLAGYNARAATLGLEARFVHNSTLHQGEPTWSDVDKAKLPDIAFADREGRRYPHHWVVNGGDPDAKGRYRSGTLFLHRGGLIAAWSAANGGHTGEKADAGILAHLERHRKAIGLDQ